MNSKYETYTASETINVDEETARFISDASEHVSLAKEQLEKIRQSKVDQELFVLGVWDIMNNKQIDTVLFDNSDSYFQGCDYGRRLNNDIKVEAKKRFPTPPPSSNPNVISYAEALVEETMEKKTLG